jgi:hypothetical protein
MKKVDFKRVLVQLLILIVVSLLIGVIGGITTQPNFTMGFAFFSVAAFIILFIVWLVIVGNGGSGKAAKKTMEEYVQKENFKNYNTFYTNNAVIVINEDGKVGYVANMNPKEFQIAMPNEISDVKSDYVKSPMGGTTMVYFSFRYKGKVTKVPTFTADHVCSMNNEKVLEGISYPFGSVIAMKNVPNIIFEMAFPSKILSRFRMDREPFT